jgi:hypothetical protein
MSYNDYIFCESCAGHGFVPDEGEHGEVVLVTCLECEGHGGFGSKEYGRPTPGAHPQAWLVAMVGKVLGEPKDDIPDTEPVPPTLRSGGKQ